MSFFRFGDQARLLAFVAQLAPESYRDVEGMGMHLLDGDYGLTLDDEKLELIDDEMLERFGASLAESPADLNGGVDLSTLHRRAKLQEVDRGLLPSTLLVLPASRHETLDEHRIRQLIAELAVLPGYRTTLYPVRFSDGKEEAVHLFQLEATQRGITTGRISLPGSPVVLAPDPSQRYYVPSGHVHPLLAEYSFLFPELDGDEKCGWFPSVGQNGQSLWQMRHFRLEGDPLPLVGQVEVESLECVPQKAVVGPVGETLSVELQVGPDLRRDPARFARASRRMYRFTSSPRALGPRLLGLLDEAEARAVDLTYFCSTADGGTIDHFVLDDRARPDDAECFAGADHVYMQPDTFDERGLNLFMREGTRFRPDLDTLLEDLPQGSKFVEHLKQKVGIDGSDTIAIVDPGDHPSCPEIQLLRGGRPLHTIIDLLIDRFHPTRISDATEAVESVVPLRAAETHEELCKLANEECEHLDYEITENLKRIEAAAKEAEGRLSVVESRVEKVGDLTDTTAERLDGLPEEWEPFVTSVCALQADLATPRFDWLHEIDRATEVKDLLTAAVRCQQADLRQWSDERLENAKEVVEVLTCERDELVAQCEEVASQHMAIDKLATEYSKQWEATTKKLGEWRESLSALEAEYIQERARAVAESDRLALLEKKLEAEAAAIRDLEAKNAESKEALTRREEALEKERATQEEERRELRQLRDVTIPELQAKSKQLVAEISTLASGKVVLSQLEEKFRQLSRAKELLDSCKELEGALRELSESPGSRKEELETRLGAAVKEAQGRLGENRWLRRIGRSS